MLSLLRSCMRPLERRFIVVNWDQRGAGKSFDAGRDPARMTMDQFVDDILELARQLRARFDGRKLVLLGHSWGSGIGMLAVARQPELFSAYVGVGQLSHVARAERVSYDWTLARAREANARSDVELLLAQGAAPYMGPGWRAKFLRQRRLLAKYGGELHANPRGASLSVLRHLLASPEYTWLDRARVMRGSLRSLDLLFPKLLELDLFERVPEVAVPVSFCLGRHDFEVPAELSAQYFEALRAPHKELLWFERSAHMPFLEEPAQFQDFMLGNLRRRLGD